MEALILPGEQVVLLVKGCDDTSPNPLIASVVAVKRGAIFVPEAESLNGIATIVCHGTSGKDGKFWYEFNDKKSDPQSKDVFELKKIGGQKIITDRFIID